ncbi:MAG: LytTR family transcriptional regulator DNA-binding domain-containing protein [Acutalibacteraceae bacterium]
MKSAYESYVVRALINYYNYDFDMFFEYLDESVIWYGPNKSQYIVGKENLAAYLNNLKPSVRFSVDDIQTKLITFASNAYTVIVSYTLTCRYPDLHEKIIYQRLTVNGQRFRDQDGKILSRCKCIQVSNLTGSQGADISKIIQHTTPAFPKEAEDSPRLILPGENHSTVYISQNSIRYIMGGKGVCCYIHTDENMYLVHILLKDVLDKLPDFFYRCHSSYIVNLKRVLFLSGKKITLNDLTEIPISPKHFGKVKADIDKWMTDKP